MIVFETTDFQKDIDEIDQFVYGRIHQETWQSNPIEFEGKNYIKYKSILSPIVSQEELVEITIPDDV